MGVKRSSLLHTLRFRTSRSVAFSEDRHEQRRYTIIVELNRYNVKAQCSFTSRISVEALMLDVAELDVTRLDEI